VKAARSSARPLLAPILAALAVITACNGGDSPAASPQPPTPTPRLVVGAQISFIDGSGNLALMSSDGTGVNVLTQGGGVQNFAWTPDGTLVGVEVQGPGGSEVKIIRRGGSVVFEETGASKPVWSRDGSRLALTLGEGVQVVDPSGAVVRNIARATRPAWSPDGTKLAAVKIDGALGTPIVVDLTSGTEVPLSSAIEPHDPVYPIAWHPGGQVIGYRNKLYDPAAATQRDLPGTAVEWSPDGRTLMVALPTAGEGGTTVFRLLDASQDLKEVIGFELPPSADGVPGQLFVQSWTDWTPDGRFLVYLDPTVTRQQVRIYDTAQAGQKRYSNIKGERPDVSPDGTVIAFMDSGKIWLLPIDGSTLNAIIDGGWPAWVSGQG
jgi:WD40-like Beta Propeller Repeat